METNTILVIGAGIMGHGIAQVAAAGGFRTFLYDEDESALKNGLKNIKNSLEKLREKEKLTEGQHAEILSRLFPAENLNRKVVEADIVIEAIVETMEIKQQLFRSIESIAPEHTIFATNTSSLSITEIASVLKEPGRLIGLHFFNPVPTTKGVEVVQGLSTSRKTEQIAMTFLQQISKEVLVSKDFPGFIVNRMLPLQVNEAFYLLWQGIASAEDIDKSMTLMLQHPIGPLRLADFSGLDTLLSVLEYLFESYGEKYRPCPLLKQLVKAGHLGRKSGKGVYEYGAPPQVR